MIFNDSGVNFNKGLFNEKAHFRKCKQCLDTNIYSYLDIW
jgi:hypothetical protein